MKCPEILKILQALKFPIARSWISIHEPWLLMACIMNGNPSNMHETWMIIHEINADKRQLSKVVQPTKVFVILNVKQISAKYLETNKNCVL